jgi:hypothetical protein
MDKAMIGGLVRHLMTAGGGFLVAKGYVDASMWAEIVGAVVAIVGVAWSLFNKKMMA